MLVLLARCSILVLARSPSRRGAPFDLQSLAIDALPLAFAAMAQAVVVISGGIDLSVGSLMGLINVLVGQVHGRHELPRGAALRARARGARRARGRVHGHADRASRGSPTSSSRSRCCSSGAASRCCARDPRRRRAAGRTCTSAPARSDARGCRPPLVILAARRASVWLPLRWRGPGSRSTRSARNRNAAYLSGVNVARARDQRVRARRRLRRARRARADRDVRASATRTRAQSTR